jgi:competence protein ComEC
MPTNGKRYYLFFVAVLLFLFDVFLLSEDLRDKNGLLTFAVLDVGQGDAIFIESPTGTQVMFDAGPPHKILGPIAKVMSPFDRSLDAVFITNPDADHIGGLLDLLKSYEVGVILESGTINESKIFENLKTEIKNKDIPNILAKKSMRILIGGDAVIEILFPDRDVSSSTTNDGSIVARLSYGDFSVMLMGDGTSETEKLILRGNGPEDLHSLFLKVGHHGSRSSSSLSFLDVVSPSYALISAGKDNKYGHPHKDVLSLLEEKEIKIFRTDIVGSIIVESDGKNFQIR